LRILRIFLTRMGKPWLNIAFRYKLKMMAF